ncbi:MAG TPA: VWA domain-containing protein [Aestuariivirgaceae bacterium]|nr:VWA domain-containing protein [Aestuariivirgaceae bacterium]
MRRRNFTQNTSGSVAVILGMVATVMIGAAGVAVDFVNASYIRTSLQHALDSAVLAASSSHVETESEAEALIHKYMDSNWKQKFPTLAVDIKPKLGKDNITSDATTQVPTMLMGILGIKDIAIHVSSTATASQNTIEVAMVIDNSASMRSNLALLKSSLLAVVDTLDSSLSSDVSYAVVPYSVYVNVGTSNRNKSWLSISDADKKSWTGCVGSRDYPLELEDSDSAAIPALTTSLCNPSELLPLTSKVSEVESWIDDLEASVDDTYMASGLIWGVRALSERDPFDEGTPDGEAQKILIFLTDGYSTLGPSYPKHESEDTAGDAMSIVSAQCTNAKAQGITIYTVAFDASADNEEALRDCATSTGHAYVADGAGDLVTAFAAIATKLSTVYLSQ